MKSSDIYGNAIEPVPGFRNIEEVARVCQQRAGLVEGMARTAGFGVLDAHFRRLRATLRGGAQNVSDEELDLRWSKCDVFTSLCDVVTAHRIAADFALGHIQGERKPIPRETFPDDMTPQQAIDAAAAVAETARHPGWGVLLREMAGRMSALANLLALTRGPARDAIRQLYTAHEAVMGEIQQIFDLGMDAEAWQRAQLEALGRKGKEQ